MKFSTRLKFAFVLAAFMTMWAGSAWAWVFLYHRAGDVAIKDGVSDFSVKPGFDSFFLRGSLDSPTPPKMGTLFGEFSIDFKNDVMIENYNDEKEKLSAGSHTFKLWPDEDGAFDLGDDQGNQLSFEEGAESALSGASFSYTINETGDKVSGTFPKITTIAAQLDKCVPFIELDFDSDEKTVKGIKWRFVRPDNTGEPVTAEGMRLGWINIDPLYSDGYMSYPIGDTYDDQPWPDNVKLQGDIPINPIFFDDLEEVRFFFRYPDAYNGDCNVTELWTFEVNDDDDVELELVSDADLEAVKAATVQLTNKPEETVKLEIGKGEIRTGTKVVNGNDTIDAWRTSTVISVEQEVEAGGALAFTSELGFAVADKSLKDSDLPDVKDMDDLKAKYSVLKHFEKAGAVDLLVEFPGIFSYYAPEKWVELNATIIIIDDRAPADEPDLKTYYNGQYGIKLVEDESENYYLYIWDGLKDGIASDPIALTAKATQDNGGSGSSGCNAGVGYGLAGLLSLAGFVTRKYRKI